jgi:hypothetical protein
VPFSAIEASFFSATNGAVRGWSFRDEEARTQDPRDAAKFMVQIFVPIADQTTSGTYLFHDGTCGKGRRVPGDHFPSNDHDSVLPCKY